MNLNGKINKWPPEEAKKEIIEKDIDIGKNLRFAEISYALEDFLNHNPANLTKEQLADFLSKKINQIKYDSKEPIEKEIIIFKKIITYLSYLKEKIDILYESSKKEAGENDWEKVFLKKIYGIEPMGKFLIERTPFGILVIFEDDDDYARFFNQKDDEKGVDLKCVDKDDGFSTFNSKEKIGIFFINGHFNPGKLIGVRNNEIEITIHERQHLIYRILQDIIDVEEKIPEKIEPYFKEFEGMEHLREITDLISVEFSLIFYVSKNELLACFKEGFDLKEMFDQVINYNHFNIFLKSPLINEGFKKNLNDEKLFKRVMETWEKIYNKCINDAVLNLQFILASFPDDNDLEKRAKITYFLTAIPLVQWPEAATQLNDYLHKQSKEIK